MDYQGLKPDAYRHSRYVLMELFSSMRVSLGAETSCNSYRLGMVFSLLTEKEKQKVFNDIAETYEQRIDCFIADIPFSEERLALFSMAYDGFDFADESLKAALMAGDRRRAWSCIRNRHQNSAAESPTARDRSWYEAEIFGREDST